MYTKEEKEKFKKALYLIAKELDAKILDIKFRTPRVTRVSDTRIVFVIILFSPDTTRELANLMWLNDTMYNVKGEITLHEIEILKSLKLRD